MIAGSSFPIPTVGDVKVLIVDDCALYREALAAVLSLHVSGSVGQAWDLPSLIGSLESTLPQVILVNLDANNVGTMLRAATSLGRKAPVIAFGVSTDDEPSIVTCAEVGVAAYHLRSDSLADLVMMIAVVQAGETYIPPGLSKILLRRVSNLAAERQSPARGPVLTTREIQILGMLELGRSNQDIAAQLSIAVHTVKNHVHSLLTKLNVSSRAEAAALSQSVRAEHRSRTRSRSRSRQN